MMSILMEDEIIETEGVNNIGDDGFGFGMSEPQLIFEIISDDHFIIRDLRTSIALFELNECVMEGFVAESMRCGPMCLIKELEDLHRELRGIHENV